MKYEKFAQFCDFASKICAVGTAAAIMLPTAFIVILFHLAVLFSLLSGKWYGKFNLLIRNPICLTFFSLFLLVLIGVTYSTAPTSEIFTVLGKHVKYVLVLALYPIFLEEKWRNYAVFSFMASVGGVLIASYLKTFGWLANYGTPGGVEIFKMSIIFNGLMAFAAYLCLFKVFVDRRYRWLWLIFFILIVYTILFRSSGRTGYFVFAGLMTVFFMQKFNWRGLLIAVVSMLLLVGLAYNFSPTFKNRINIAFDNIKVYQKVDSTSVGLRITFVKNSIQLIKAHPFFGTGVGSYPYEYNKVDPRSQFWNPPIWHPHNEYIHFMVQFGIMGLIIMLMIFAIQLWYSQFLPEQEKYIARGVIVMVMIGSLANCWLTEMGIRYCYAYFAVLAFAALPSMVNFFPVTWHTYKKPQ